MQLYTEVLPCTSLNPLYIANCSLCNNDVHIVGTV